MPTRLAPSHPTPPTPPPAAVIPKLSAVSTAMIALFGIVIPTVTSLVEALLHMCADAFFDPMPTVGHVFALAAVPLANVAALWALRTRAGRHVHAIIFAQAFAVGVAGVYAVIF